ncbi:MAG: YHS domain-containing protein, partial [Phreatobacter sp.]|nr:YHS domain-containing protein [Phreatobacter sp.]
MTAHDHKATGGGCCGGAGKVEAVPAAEEQGCCGGHDHTSGTPVAAEPTKTGGCCGGHGANGHHHHGHDQAAHAHMAQTAPADGKVIDPVCGMTVDPLTTPHKATHQGVHHYFCSAGCVVKFQKDPLRYLDPSSAPPPEPVAEGTMFTCPMHLEIQQIGPGTCPICGMALEPMMVTADAGPNEELIDMTRRFWAGLVLTLPVLALEMGGHIFGWDPLPHGWSSWVQLLLATPVVLWAGWP